MELRTRKLFGTVLLLAFIIVYSLVVMVLMATVLPHAGSTALHVVFFALAGLAWVPVAMLIVSWMHRTG